MGEPVRAWRRGARRTTIVRRPGRWRSAGPSARGPARCCGAGHPGGRTAPGAMRRPGRRAGGGAGARRAGRAGAVRRRSTSRSWSGRSESSCVGEGNSPSASPRTTTRSRSRPTPMLTEPTSTPFAHAPDPTEVGLELELQGAGEHVEVDRLLDRVQAGQPVQGPLDPFGRLLLGQRPGGPAALAAEQRAQDGAGPSRPARPTAEAGRPPAARSSIRPSDEPAQGPGPVGLGAQASRPATRERRDRPRPARASSSRLAAKVARRRSQSLRPATTPASRDSRSQAVTGIESSVVAQVARRPARRRRPRAGTRRSGRTRRPEQRAADHPGRERHDGGPVQGDAGRRQLLVGQPGVGLGAGVQDGHAIERRPRPGRIDDGRAPPPAPPRRSRTR